MILAVPGCKTDLCNSFQMSCFFFLSQRKKATHAWVVHESLNINLSPASCSKNNRQDSDLYSDIDIYSRDKSNDSCNTILDFLHLKLCRNCNQHKKLIILSILRQFQVINAIPLISFTGNNSVWRELISFHGQKIICRESGKNLIKSSDLFQHWVIYSYNKQLCNFKLYNFIINHVTLEIFILQVQKMPGVFYSLP